MDLPITHYYINSARNTFQSNLDYSKLIQAEDDSQIKDWKNCFLPLYHILKLGVRYMEIEIWDGEV